MDWTALIESQPVLATIPPRLREVAGQQEIRTGETLFRLGDRLRGVFCVIRGEVRLIRRARNGEEMILQRSLGGFFAEASVYAKTYHCDAVAARPSSVLHFPAQAFRSALGEYAAFSEAWMAHLASEVRKLRAQCERLSLKTAQARIVHFIDTEGTGGVVTLSQSRKAWAAELGLTHEALYRTLRRLQTNGVLVIEGDRITLWTAKRRLV